MRFMKGTLALSALVLSSAAAFAADAPRFLILVKGGDRGTRSAEEQKAVVQDYVAWARSLRESGHLVSADELAAKSRVRTGKNQTGMERKASAGGYFLVNARDMDEALTLSRACPCLKHGGSAEVTAIVGN
jgi:hypothetical protein